MDNSWKVIAELVEKDSRVQGIKLARNYGQHNALLCGIRAAQGEVIATLDDDLQNPPEEIPKLLAKLDEGYDVVYGAPLQEQHGFLRNQASRITKLVLQGAMGAETASKVSAFRVFRKFAKEIFLTYSNSYVNIDVLLTWGTNRFGVVHVRHDGRKKGTSGYTVGRLFTHAFNMITGFSVVPLQIASILGFGFGVGGGLTLCYVLVRYFMSGNVVPGFPFLAAIIAIFSGVQLVALGIFGEYLARIHFRTSQWPMYYVRESVKAEHVISKTNFQESK